MLGLDFAAVRGQTYDGAGNMAGHTRGVASRILQAYPKAVYVHCNSHVLNLCIMSACEVQAVRNMLVTCKSVNLFFDYSSERLSELKNVIREVCPESTRSRLVSLRKTLWSARHTALETFEDLIVPMLDTLDGIGQNVGGHWNQKSTSSANQVALAIRQFLF